jgi:simple sugar transport system substrate-binding protein
MSGCGNNDQQLNKEAALKAKQQIIVGYAQLGSESGWRNANTKSVKDAAKEAGITLIFKNAEGNQNEQIKSIKEFIIQQVDVITFPPIVKDGWDEVLKEAKAAQIPVILCDREINTKDPTLYISSIGSDFKSEGVKAAEWLIKASKNNHKTINIIEIEGTTGSAPAVDRQKGFNKTVRKYSKFKIIDSITADFIRAKGKDVMNAMLKKHGRKIDVIFSHNDEMALGAIEAIKEQGLKPGKDILVVSVDGQKNALEAIIAGEMNVSVECTPLLGPDLMKAAKDLKAGKKLPRKIIPEEKVFTIENAAKELPYRLY